jgi:hypothetical protein
MTTLDARTLGMAMDMVDEDDAVLGVVGRGTKAERVAVRYDQLMRLTMPWIGVPDANGDIHCSRLAPKRCMYLEGHYGGCATP